MTSNEAYIGLADGDVTCTRAVARRMAIQQWNRQAVLSIKGAPGKPRPRNPEDDAIIEAYQNPHLSRDAELRLVVATHDRDVQCGYP